MIWRAARSGTAPSSALAVWMLTRRSVLATTMIGTEDGVRERIRTWRDTGVTTVRLYPSGDTLDEKLDTLGRALDIVRSLNDATSPQRNELEGSRS